VAKKIEKLAVEYSAKPGVTWQCGSQSRSGENGEASWRNGVFENQLNRVAEAIENNGGG
jgi:hypothetical protein